MKAAFFETVSHLLSYLAACLNLHQDFLDFLLIQSPLPDFFFFWYRITLTLNLVFSCYHCTFFFMCMFPCDLNISLTEEGLG